MSTKEPLPRKREKNELFAERMTLLRKKRGAQQKEVAKDLGFSIATLSTYENGREPRYEYLNRIANYYNVTVDYLTGNSDYVDIKEYALNTLFGIKEKETVDLIIKHLDSLVNKSLPATLLLSIEFITLLNLLAKNLDKVEQYKTLKFKLVDVKECPPHMQMSAINICFDLVNDLYKIFDLNKADRITQYQMEQAQGKFRKQIHERANEIRTKKGE